MDEQKKPKRLTKAEVHSVAEVIAQSVEDWAKVGEGFRSSRLTRRAQLVLLRDMTGLGITEIDRVLTALPQLAKTYIKTV